jgi:hypothetical protein
VKTSNLTIINFICPSGCRHSQREPTARTAQAQSDIQCRYDKANALTGEQTAGGWMGASCKSRRDTSVFVKSVSNTCKLSRLETPHQHSSQRGKRSGNFSRLRASSVRKYAPPAFCGHQGTYLWAFLTIVWYSSYLRFVGIRTQDHTT